VRGNILYQKRQGNYNLFYAVKNFSTSPEVIAKIHNEVAQYIISQAVK
jgi:hypothetical protein